MSPKITTEIDFDLEMLGIDGPPLSTHVVIFYFYGEVEWRNNGEGIVQKQKNHP